jgi:magnesium chelatase family protein
MVVRTLSAALQGIDAIPVYCETVATNGCRIILIGLPDLAVKESRDRLASALRESGYAIPRKQITINLAPADVRKEGSLYDLPIAISILAADGTIPAERLEQYMMVGELSLDGTVNPVKGCLPMAILAREKGLKGIIVPRENAREAAVVNRLEVLVADNLAHVVAFLMGKGELERIESDTRELFRQAQQTFPVDFAYVKGQENVKRAFTVAAAGGHNLIMIGPPGAGKTMMAKCLPSILPPITLAEALETTKIHSVSGIRAESGLITHRPFRAPHHTLSSVALIGGGANPMPGEVSLAHNGVLYMDELPEFHREALEVLRQPLEDRQICIARARQTVTYPASVMMVASMNPCPCGYYNHPTHPCTCNQQQVQKYLNRISGPLLDRIDIQVEILPLSFEEMSRRGSGEPSSAIRERVTRARQIQEQRYADHPGVHCNAQMTPALLHQYADLDERSLGLLRAAMTKLDLSARAYDRILKVARTIADLAGEERVSSGHIAEAISYRQLDRPTWGY